MAKKKKKKNLKHYFYTIKNGCSGLIRFIHYFLSNMMVRSKKQRKKNPIVPWQSMIHLCLFSFVFIYDEVLLRFFNGKGIFNHLIYPVLFGICAGIFVNVLTTIFSKKINRIISVVIMTLISVLFITETLVKQTFRVYMTIPNILSGADGVAGNYTVEMLHTIAGGLFVVICFLIPVILYLLLGKKILPAYQYKWPAAILHMISCFALFLVSIAFASFGPSRLAYTSQYEFNNSTETFGLLTSMRLSMTRGTAGLTSIAGVNENDEWVGEDYSIYKKNELDIDFDSLKSKAKGDLKDMDKYVESVESSSRNKFTGLFKGKNLILICAEAFHDAVVSKELTPTLYRMIHKGFYFSNFYQPTWGGSTSSGEYSFLMGNVPTYGIDTMLKVKDNNNYFTMGNQMQRLGYYTGAYHIGEYNYYNRDLTHENLGYNYWKSIGNGLEELCDAQTDFQMFDRTFDEYKDHQPFSMYFMSMDGHSEYTPYSRFSTENWDYVTSVIGTDYSEEVIAYYCYQYSFEVALENLVQKLEEAGILDDTVICICPDHFPYGLAEGAYNNPADYFSELIGEENTDHLTQDRNSMVLWSSCLEEGKELERFQCEISSPVYSLDILPTLSNLFGLEFDSRMMVGRDVFSDRSPLVVWTDYSWLSNKGYYESATGEFYPYEGEENVTQEYIDTMSSLAQNKINFSRQVIDNDYYKHVFGKDDVTDSTKVTLDKDIAKIIKKREEEKETKQD